MSAIETYNEKVLLVNNLEKNIADMNNNINSVQQNITNMEQLITTTMSEKTVMDNELLAEQSNLPNNAETYNAKLIECNNCDSRLNNLNYTKNFMENNLNNLNETLTALNANKATADAELSAALAAL
jgi:prefoldin subunit 5